MNPLLGSRAAATAYLVLAGDTLESIALAQCPGLGWKLLARYNFGTDLAVDLRRALCDAVGVRVADLNDAALKDTPEKLHLAPDADLAPQLRVPVAWAQAGLAVGVTHTVKVKPITPATTVTLPTLDKWFVPGIEQCQLKLLLGGRPEDADQLALEVFGNAYCDTSALNRGLGTYTDPAALIDEPVFAQALPEQAARRGEMGLPGNGWKGQVSTTRGLLGRVTKVGQPRHVNVAFSPYTVHARLYKDGGDANAHLVLKPFWPQWDESVATPAVTPTVAPATITLRWDNPAKIDQGALEVLDATGQRVHVAVLPETELAAGGRSLVWDRKYLPGVLNGRFAGEYLDDTALPARTLLFQSQPYVYRVTTRTCTKKDASLKLAWEVRHTSRLTQGCLEIVDGQDRLVFAKPLTPALLSQGEQSFQWDGQYAAGVTNSVGGTEVIPADMPYRARLLAHTGVSEPKGLALAAMHTEVRLYVPKEALLPSNPGFEPVRARPAGRISPGPWVPGDPPADDGGGVWIRYTMAQAGFHPGPVQTAASPEYHTALREFKRSVPVNGSVAAGQFRRQSLTGGADVAENDQLLNALRTLRAGDRRALFGNPARIEQNSNAPDLSNAEYQAWLQDAEREIVVWVDDRQCYTQDPRRTDNPPGHSFDDAGRRFFDGNTLADTFALMNHRGAMSVGDNRAALDEAAIPRPWVPLKAEFSLLSRADPLHPPHRAKSVLGSDERRKATASAMGPLRVDWGFDELPPDLANIRTDLTNYDKNFIRSRYYVGWALRTQAGNHTPPDTGRQVSYTNCKLTRGGSRPDAGASYYEQLFGSDDRSLMPWRATKVAAAESVMTVLHDHISGDQRDGETLYPALIGSAGAFFTPSRVAGDGYRVHAAMRFEAEGDYAFPNVEALKARYPVPPRVDSAGFRVWRRTSFRGYICWGPATGNWNSAFINEVRKHYRNAHVYFVHEGGAKTELALNTMFDATSVADRNRFAQLISRNVTRASLKVVGNISLQAGHIWPWSGQDDFGWPDPTPDLNASADPDGDISAWEDEMVTATWRHYRYALITELLAKAERQGLLRGHLLVEFVASSACRYQEYECNGPSGPHAFMYLQNSTAPNRMVGLACPAPGCSGAGGVLALSPVNAPQDHAALPLPAVGSALGATWLFHQGEAIPRLKVVWAHEVYHHRHGEHSQEASGPANQHDSQANTRNTVWNAALGNAPKDKGWDRRCIMSYADGRYGEYGCFCGRCLLRNRGWSVTAGLGFPAGDHNEP